MDIQIRKKAEKKLEALKKELSGYERLIIAYSGGLDSALLLKVAHMMLGDNVLAVISDSPSIPRRELQEAVSFANGTGARIRVINTRELDDQNYSRNPDDRCYYCKKELYEYIGDIAAKEGIKYVANGTNLDDLGDYRPGLKAADEHQVVSPLKDAGLTKDDIRLVARLTGLDIWDKPASPCLASRIPYGSSVTRDKLSQVERAEEFVRSFGAREIRVRHFDRKAVLEVNPVYREIVEKNLSAIKDEFALLGFYETEVKDFKSGSLNQLININAKR
ncbi:MAG: ATP-dependent sacrificial sulfur transferase LarE [Marinilabiliales bacterium]|nr:MAG: ATP-dependent sacrificial sulfur transferase LarE [Marinilabiliales bacterium]